MYRGCWPVHCTAEQCTSCQVRPGCRPAAPTLQGHNVRLQQMLDVQLAEEPSVPTARQELPDFSKVAPPVCEPVKKDRARLQVSCMASHWGRIAAAVTACSNGARCHVWDPLCGQVGSCGVGIWQLSSCDSTMTTSAPGTFRLDICKLSAICTFMSNAGHTCACCRPAGRPCTPQTCAALRGTCLRRLWSRRGLLPGWGVWLLRLP